MSKKKWKIYIKYLESFKEENNRGVLAILRRSVSLMPEVDIKILPYTYPGIKLANIEKFDEKIAYQVAGFFALYNMGSSNSFESEKIPKSLGESFGFLTNKDEKGSKSLEQRFMALLNSHNDDLYNHIKYAINLLRSRNIPVNWDDIAYGMKQWSHPDKFVQMNWARDYYNSLSLKDHDSSSK